MEQFLCHEALKWAPQNWNFENSGAIPDTQNQVILERHMCWFLIKTESTAIIIVFFSSSNLIQQSW